MPSTKPLTDTEKLRKDFPILSRKIHNNKQLVYFDNAATSQKPIQVIEAMNGYYRNYNANVHRSIHHLGEEATEKFIESHEKAAGFINADNYQNIIFTKGTTESLNLLAYSLTAGLKKGDEIVISQMEHHSNFVPWQQLAKQRSLKIKYIEIDDEGKLDGDSIKKNITKKTKIVSLTHVSNVLGTINPIKEITKIAHENGALFVADGAQSAPHMPVDVKKLDVDFYAFSGHKMLGPTGIGVLFGKKELLDKMQPFLYGGEMIREVRFDDTTFNELPWKFEAGTPNIAEAVGFGAAIDYLQKIGMENVQSKDKELAEYAAKELAQQKDITIYGPKERGAVVSFNLKGVHAHDVSQVLDSEGIAIRAGHHCCMPLMKVMHLNSTARASFYFYNTKKEIDSMVKALDKVRKVFG